MSLEADGGGARVEVEVTEVPTFRSRGGTEILADSSLFNVRDSSLHTVSLKVRA